MNKKHTLSYQDAGVSIDAGNALVQRIKSIAARTRRSEVLTGLGGFAALYELPLHRFQQPILVSTTDGVGTKLRLAIESNRHSHIGIDLVAMCVNDLVVCGAEPVLFLDYYATGQLNVDVAASVIEGIGQGCEMAGAALVGGETAEMPGMYADQDYDLAGFCVGLVDKKNIIDGKSVKAGDVLIGLPSSGPHSNGYSLIRKIIEVSQCDLNAKLGDKNLIDILLEPTCIYVKPLLELFKNVSVKALAHITGGGLLENIPRVLPENCQARIEKSTWKKPLIFDWLQEQGNVSDLEMFRTFNCGIGMVLCVAKEDVSTCIQQLNNLGEPAFVIGSIDPLKDNQPHVVII